MNLQDTVALIFTVTIVLGFGYMIGLVIYNNSKRSRTVKPIEKGDHHNKPELMNSSTSIEDLILAIRSNPLTKISLIEISRKLKLSDLRQSRIADLPLEDYLRKPLDFKLSIASSETIIKISKVYEIGLTTFDDDESMLIDWLNTPIPALRNHVPIELMETVLGADLVMDEIYRIEYGIWT